MRCFSDNKTVKRKGLLGERGVISQMMCVIIAGFILFNFAMFDYISVSHQRLVSKRVNDLACTSVMASFDKIFQESFGLYCLDSTKAENYLARYYEIMSENSGSLLSSLIREKNYDKFFVSKRNVGNYSIAYADSLILRQVLKREIEAIMKFRTATNFAEFVIDKITTLTGIKKETDVYCYLNQFDNKLETINSLHKELNALINGAEGIEGTGVNGFSAGLNGIGFANEADKILSSCPAVITSEDERLLSLIDAGLDVLIIPANIYSEYCRDALNISQKMEKLKNDAEDLLEKAEDASEASSGLSSDSYGSIESRRKQLEDLTDFVQISNILQSNIDTLSEAKNSMYLFRASVERDGRADVYSLRETVQSINNAYNNYKEIKTEEVEETQQPDANIKDLFDKAVEAAGVFTDFYPSANTEIDEKTYKTMPSQRAGVRESDPFGRAFGGDIAGAVFSDSFSNISDMLNKAPDKTTIRDLYFIDDYIMSYFKSAIQGGNNSCSNVLNGELEYVIFGSRKDNDNYLSSVLSISAIRLFLNISHILRDKDKMEEIETISDHPAIIAVIVLIWGLYETAFDVSYLLRGYSVPFVKTEDDWHCDLNGAQKYVESVASGEDEEESDNITNMTYEDYLRLLLVFVDYNTKIARLQDLLEMNYFKLCGKYRHLDDFVTTVRLESEVFIDTVLFRSKTGRNRAGWTVISDGSY